MQDADHSAKRPQQHLLNILTQVPRSRFILFLGAGASISSKVMGAGDMVAVFRQKYHRAYGQKATFDEFLREQSWYGQADEYSTLFEKIYDHPSQRRDYIEECLSTATPSWGYIYLVNLLRTGVFNTVFTTNFDDLLNESCYIYSDLRPLVCAHDSSIHSVRMTSSRPKIIKLHGDFLFDNIKNTSREVESLEQNMRDKFKQYATEFGMVVIGYSGRDRSVMETLDDLLRKDSNFPHGIYWCVMKGQSLSQQAADLCRFPRFRTVEIDGFDEFFAELHECLELELQQEVSDPYAALASRLNSMVGSAAAPVGKVAHPRIDRDIQLLVRRVAQVASKRIDPHEDNAIEIAIGPDTTLKLPIPYELLAMAARRTGAYKDSLHYLLRQIDQDPAASTFETAFETLRECWLDEQASALMSRLRSCKRLFAERPMVSFNIAVELILARQFDLADEVLEMGASAAATGSEPARYNRDFYLINKAQIFRHKDAPLPDEFAEEMKRIAAQGQRLAQYGAHVLLGNYREAERILKEIRGRRTEEGTSFETICEWPITLLLRQHIKDQELRRQFESCPAPTPACQLEESDAIASGNGRGDSAGPLEAATGN